MIHLFPYIFRSLMYIMLGLSTEVIFSATLLNRVLGINYTPVVHYMMDHPFTHYYGRSVWKYREGFVSLYMIPLYALAIPFLFEPFMYAIYNFPWYIKFIIYAAKLTLVEIAYGWLMMKCFGFYVWDYYRFSKYKIFKQGYSIWTLVPFWGLAGLVLEQYCRIMIHITPYVLMFFFHYDTI